MTEHYDGRGVSSQKEDVHAAIASLSKGLFPKAFCKVIPDMLTGDADFCLAMHADGAGTKSSLAYAWWKETGDLSIWKGIAQDAIVMNTDDLLCAGATGTMLLSSTIGRNKKLIPGEVISALINGTEEVLAELRSYGLDIHSTGGETADLGDLVRTLVVDSSVVTRLKRDDVIDNDNIKAGNVIVGLSSYGQATYESRYNSGIGSNGLTSARHDVFSKEVGLRYPETFDASIEALAYLGGFQLADRHPSIPISLAEAVLSPTRTYAPILIPFINEYRSRILGLIHCSGGGQKKILHFLPEGLKVVKDNLMEPAPLFDIIRQSSGTSWMEMYSVFNMGHRMEVYTDLDTAEALIKLSKTFGVEAAIVGEVQPIEEDGIRWKLLSPEGWLMQ
jgi:phosphoribosylformylglycinamidine cyclo-ligase